MKAGHFRQSVATEDSKERDLSGTKGIVFSGLCKSMSKGPEVTRKFLGSTEVSQSQRRHRNERK